MKKIAIIIISIASFNIYAQSAKDYFEKGKGKYKHIPPVAIKFKDGGIKVTDNMSNDKTINGNKEAIADFTKAIELDPKYTEAYYMRGLAENDFMATEEATKDWEKAIELDPKHDKSYLSLGALKINNGDKVGGCQDLKTASELGNSTAKKFYKSYSKAGYCK